MRITLAAGEHNPASYCTNIAVLPRWAYVEDLATRIARLEAATALGAHLLQLECLSGTRVGRAAPPEHRLVLADRAQVLGLLLAAAHRAIPECAADGNLLADYSPITLVGLINGRASCVVACCFACDALLSLLLPMLLLEEDRAAAAVAEAPPTRLRSSPSC